MCCSPNRKVVRAATHYHMRALANVNTEKNVISSLLYTFLSSTPGLNGNEALCSVYEWEWSPQPVIGQWSATLWHIKFRWNVQLSRVETCQVSIVNTYKVYNNMFYKIVNNVVCATIKASDQPAHMRSLIRAFVCLLNILLVLSYWLNFILSFKS